MSQREAFDTVLAALKRAREGLYNGFEPDNQSRLYRDVDDAIKTAGQARALFVQSESEAIVALRAELEQERDIRSTREITLSLVADGLGVEHEPHQTFDERLLEASCAPPLRTAWLIECPKYPLAYYQSGPRLGIDLVDGEFITNPWQADQFTAKDGAEMFIKALRTNPRFTEYEMTAVLHEFGVQKGGG